jgi:hypothetical protein
MTTAELTVRPERGKQVSIDYFMVRRRARSTLTFGVFLMGKYPI